MYKCNHTDLCLAQHYNLNNYYERCSNFTTSNNESCSGLPQPPFFKLSALRRVGDSSNAVVMEESGTVPETLIIWGTWLQVDIYLREGHLSSLQSLHQELNWMNTGGCDLQPMDVAIAH